MVDRVSVDKAIAWVVGVGASRGLGAAAARRFAREGFAVAVTGRSPEALAIIADEISTAGGHAIAAVGDVQDETGIMWCDLSNAARSRTHHRRNGHFGRTEGGRHYRRQ
jgi:NADP-dependent 3-hydroxy acid dehydrogenase YdfG